MMQKGKSQKNTTFFEFPVTNKTIFPAFTSIPTNNEAIIFENVDSEYRIAIFEGDSDDIDKCKFIGGFDISSDVYEDDTLKIYISISNEGRLRLCAKLGNKEEELDYQTKIEQVCDSILKASLRSNTHASPTLTVGTGLNSRRTLDTVTVDYFDTEGILRISCLFPDDIDAQKITYDINSWKKEIVLQSSQRFIDYHCNILSEPASVLKNQKTYKVKVDLQTFNGSLSSPILIISGQNFEKEWSSKIFDFHLLKSNDTMIKLINSVPKK